MRNRRYQYCNGYESLEPHSKPFAAAVTVLRERHNVQGELSRCAAPMEKPQHEYVRQQLRLTVCGSAAHDFGDCAT